MCKSGEDGAQEVTTVPEAIAQRPGLLRRIYEWVLHWAETPYGTPALFLLALAESSFFPVPPDVLLIALAISLPARALRYAAVCSLGSVLGGMLGYAIGWGAWEQVDQFFYAYVPGVDPETYRRVASIYERYNFWAVFTAGFTPIPYKVFTIAAGVFQINFPIFLLASGLSRSARFFLVGGLIWKYGAPVRGYLEKYFDVLALAFVILLILGFVVVKYVLP